MVKFNFDEQFTYHKLLQENCSAENANEFIALSKVLCHKVIENNGYITGISLSYPDDCNSLITLAAFSNFFDYPCHLAKPTTVTFD